MILAAGDEVDGEMVEAADSNSIICFLSCLANGLRLVQAVCVAGKFDFDVLITLWQWQSEIIKKTAILHVRGDVVSSA